MKRLPDWCLRLAELVEARLHVPFAWGPNDCAAWSADVVVAETGHDHLAELRGPRRTALEAMRQEQAIGGIPAALERAGLRQVLPTQARRGDLVLLRPQPGQARGVLAVCLGEVACAPGPDGLASVPMSQARTAWRVG